MGEELLLNGQNVYPKKLLQSGYQFKIKSLDEFCDKSNIQINDAGIDNWEERGFASKRWIIFKNDSIYHYIFANA
mgnify:CR=1 FL=1